MESERPVYRRDYVHLSDIPSLRFGTKGQGEGQFWDPAGVASNTKGDIIVSDSNNHRVQVFGHVGGFLFQFGSPGKGQGQFQHPAGVAVDRFNRILIADSLNHRIQIFDDKGVFLRSFGSEGRNDGEFDSIGGIAIEPGSGNYYVADYRNHRVQVFDPEGKFLWKFGSAGSGDGQFDLPSEVRFLADGKIVVGDFCNRRIQFFDPKGNFVKAMEQSWPRFLFVDSDDNIWVTGSNRIEVFHEGRLVRTLGHGEVNFPAGICMDGKGRIIVAELNQISIF